MTFKRDIKNDSGRIYTTVEIDDSRISFTLEHFRTQGAALTLQLDKKIIPQLNEILTEYLNIG